ncbi:prenyltransferase/squalene oxidase repeat-containing protein [Solwaraspora sp. WMMD937]|uniref:prenyltransferase/squalene oxidase repeat-containing protein n=1 Tax=Solwaraspora sp. WMMD937 TaxID=3016090 RepID=UPI00249A909A|nr:prenyltransferase/squalene oxidase repeat-containing protein [Solwaraspora sp. WMMD937]WFE19698.1 prenyltransferase/squalene oxidase repeat-containing protein [Solwaraspora sp. WMMD937]
MTVTGSRAAPGGGRATADPVPVRARRYVGPVTDSWDRAAQEIVDRLPGQPWGRTDVSVYETARLVSLAPWLTGHRARVRHLLASQQPDGSWGGPGGYALVPTLSAVEALLGVRAVPPVRSSATPLLDATSLPDATMRGLTAAHRILAATTGGTLPDTPAADLIVAALVDRINQRIRHRPGLPASDPPLRLRGALDSDRLDAVRRLSAGGRPVPTKLLHAYETFADQVAPPSRPAVAPVPAHPLAGSGTGGQAGTVGGSPAATAAWLATIDPVRTEVDPMPARRYLETVVRQHHGPVPCATPVAVFERAWVLTTLLRADVAMLVPPELPGSLRAALTPAGAATGAGLPPDADTTAVVLHCLALLGQPADPAVLLGFRVGDHIATWPGEDGASVTTNAHALDTLQAVGGGRRAADLDVLRRSISTWLCDQQQPDGSWQDRWHASPYYATAACALALSAAGTGARPAAAVLRAVDWVLRTQRPDGSWGRWHGTAEETAYAVRILLDTTDPPSDRMLRAARRGAAHLVPSTADQGPALWHDKDLYQPITVVAAEIVAAGKLAHRARVTGVNRHA